MIRKQENMSTQSFAHCHDGEGALLCTSLLDGFDSKTGLCFMHWDEIPAGVSIGEHTHTQDEEVYYLVQGQGELIYNGERTPFAAGDVSVVEMGDSHGFVNTSNETAYLVVYCVKQGGTL